MPLSPDVALRARGRSGTTLGGKYRLEALLGVGGMAAVYKAIHRNKKRVAVKILHSELSIDDTIRTRFLREGYAANTVDHPGAVAVFDDDVAEDGSAYLVMELLHGETLDARAERLGGKLPPDEVLELTAQLLDVLASAHSKGIIHRDIKPENLFLTTDGLLKVLDFGIARLRELSGPVGGSTAAGSSLGTPGFMAPEQALGKSELIDYRSDVWAVGATMFALLSGHTPHEGGTAAELLVRAATEPARSLAVVAPELGEPIVSIVDKALAFERSARWPGVRTMQEAVRAVQAELHPAPDLRMKVAPVPEHRVDQQAETLVASQDEVSNMRSPSGSGAPLAARTELSVATSATAEASSPKSRSFAIIAVVVATAGVALGVAFVLGRSSTRPEAESARGVTIMPSIPASDSPSRVGPVAPSAAQVEPTLAAPPEPSSISPAASSSAQASQPSAPKHAVAKKAAKAPATPAKAPAGDDPLAKRY